jgi:hypothetical protein
MFLRNIGSQRTTRRHIPEDGTLQNYRCENFKSYKAQRISFEIGTEFHASKD